ncbi:transposase domain-containing protein [Streptomyces chartreusis]|uniref:transposase domain-containing protein n=1 Tax=Streptomyces chartreusis TaxID=1969 RepID=UPI0036289CD2
MRSRRRVLATRKGGTPRLPELLRRAPPGQVLPSVHRLAPAARNQLRRVSGLIPQIGSDLPDRRLGPRLVQRDRVRLELRRIVLHDHEMSVLRSSGSSVSCVQDQRSRILGELTQIVDFVLADAVIQETGSREKRLRPLPSRVVVCFVLALTLLGNCSCRGVWGKDLLTVQGPTANRNSTEAAAVRDPRRAHRPPRAARFVLSGLRTVTVDGTLLHVPTRRHSPGAIPA